MNLLGWLRSLWSGVPADARDRVDVDAAVLAEHDRLAGLADLAPQLYVECPPAFDCEHRRWEDVRVDASAWCDVPHRGLDRNSHPGVRCPVCGCVRDLILEPDPRGSWWLP